MNIADTIDWRRVKSVSMLCTVSEIYKINKRYEESQEILLLAYDRYPTGRNIVYALCELAIKMDDIVQAIEYYKEYTRIAPEDTGSYILLYKIYEAQNVTIEERIETLEEFKKRDYREKWAYELATLYHKTGQETKCVETCDELILWFGEGKYVQKAMELKMQHTHLSGDQQRKYNNASNQNNVNNQNNGYGQGNYGQNGYNQGSSYGQDNGYGQNAYGQNNGYDQNNPYGQNNGYNQNPYDQNASYNQDMNYGNGMPYPQNMYSDQGMNVQPVNSNQPKFNTMNLQEELTRSMNEYMPQEDSSLPYYGYGQQVGQAIYEMPAMGQPAQQNVYGQPNYDQPVDIQPGYEPIYGPEQYAQDINKAQELNQKNDEMPVEPEKPVQHEASNEAIQGYAGKINDNDLPVKEDTNNITAGYGIDTTSEISDPDMVEKQITGQLDFNDILKSLEEPKKESEQDKQEESPNKTLNQSPDIMSQLAGVIPGGVLPSGRIMTLDEEYGGNLAKIREDDRLSQEEKQKVDDKALADAAIAEEIVKPVVEEEEKPVIPEMGIVKPEIEKPVISEPEIAKPVISEPEIVKPVISEPEIEKPVIAEPEIVKPVIAEPETVKPVIEKPAMDINIDDIPEITFEFEADEEGADDVSNKDISSEASYSEKSEDDEVEIDTVKKSSPYEMNDYGEVEEIAEIEEAEEASEDILQEAEQTNSQLSNASNISSEVAEETEEAVTEYVPRKYNNHPSYMTRNEEIRAKRELNEEEKQIFIRYAGIEALKAQLVEAMDKVSLEASHGNIIITCPDICDRKGLTIDIVKAIQAKEKTFSGKVAKISGEALNKKNIPVTLNKLQNGALIVESAGGLTRDSLNIITNTLSGNCPPVIVLLEGTRESMDNLLSGTGLISKVFDARISITRFTTDDLVAYGKGYAREQEYSFDEMGVLALYNRIEDMQAFDHSVSVSEVKEIIDAAIKHVDKKNMTHFMDILVGKRYDDDDFIILREKDFIV